MEIDTQNIDREIIETREKQQSLHSEKGRDMQDSNQIFCFEQIVVKLRWRSFKMLPKNCWAITRPICIKFWGLKLNINASKMI